MSDARSTGNRRARRWQLLLPTAGAAVLVLVSAYVALRPDEPACCAESEPTGLDVLTALSGPTDVAGTAHANAPVPSSTAGVRGWEDVAVDGDIHLDRAGHIIPDLALRRLFDFFMTARGVLSEEQIRERLLQEARYRGLSQGRQGEFDALFARYRGYLDVVGTITPQGQRLEALRAATDSRRQLRREMLGPAMADGFFAMEEAEEGFVLARMEIMNDKGLGPQQRAARIDALLAELPEPVRESERSTRMLEQLDARTAQLLEAGADSARLFTARAEIVGTQAAERLAQLDEEESAWQSRMKALRQQYIAIRSAPGLSPADKEREVDALIERQFSDAEALRARAYLTIADSEALAASRADKDKNMPK